jgi:superfamily II DNA/RNA helicase
LETIAASFALDVPVAGLLVLPATAPVKRAVTELRELGVNAKALDLANPQGEPVTTPEAAEPSLLVATLSTIRGLDLPELSHVFLMAIPGLKLDEYLHIAGRVGRFGKKGWVVCVLEAAGETPFGRHTSHDQAEVMGHIYRKLGILPVKFGDFE